ncbi:hypothetical protein [Anaeromyxobacter sp. Fw109-5]|uniref:DUF6982 domain-containing protein n=1 Tax=Anaeromyxobacter sp. (strain Fw109-5) TaxID=404589 RepID=UPI0000ED7A9B|nr:hypothetical protein [Anaeromyxobacter sp. Fw109-5]ABS24287.1 conserved hypothetical protein [Anaeromyxobacter sp. Fw109-5]
MPDPRSVMQEFRTLDAKRRAGKLSPEEERRLAELRDLVGGDAGGGAPRGGFDVNAAAARLRESLLPAGLRNRPPPPPELSPEPEPEPFFPASAPPVALEAAPAEPAGENPLADLDPSALFDPATLGWEGELGAQPPYDPAALPQETAAWDPNAAAPPWDPGAASQDPASWDPNAPEGAQAWDPAAIPQDAAWDPSAGAEGQPWDPATLADETAAWAPDALPADPGAPPAWDPASAAGWDPSGDAAASPTPDDAAAWSGADGAAAPLDPAALAGAPALAYDDAGLPEAGLQPAGIAPEPFDLSALGGEGEAAWDPASLAADGAAEPAFDGGWDAGLAPEAEPEPTRAFPLGAAAPAGALEELPALDLDAADLDLLGLEDVALAAEPEGAELDPASAPEPTQLLGLASEPEPTQTLPLGGDASTLPPAGWDPTPPPAPSAPGAPLGAYDEDPGAGASAFGPDDGLSLDAGFSAEPGAPIDATAAFALGEYDDTAAFAPGAVFEPPADGFEAGEPLALDPDGSALDGAGDWPPGAALDPDFSLASGGSFDAADPGAAWATAEAPAPWELAAGAAAAPVAHADATPDAAEADSVTESHSLVPVSAAAPDGDDLSLPEIVEEIPTVDGEEILEEIPADEADLPPPALDFAAPATAAAPRPAAAPPAAVPAPAPRPAAATSTAPAAPAAPAPRAATPAAPAAVAPPPALSPARGAAVPAPPSAPEPPRAAAMPARAASPAGPTVASGTQRVVVHTLEGTVKRGVVEDLDLAAPALALLPAPGAAGETIATEKVKAIFFMLAPGEPTPAAEGKKVRVTFRDGRQVAGYSPDYREDGPGFFMVPGDTRTNTGRIWVYRAAVKEVSVS